MANNITDEEKIGVMESIKSCGVIVFRKKPKLSFLLMRHKDRWDFPKGHVDPGETELRCALRELHEETGIDSQQIELDPQFRFSMAYTIYHKKYNFEPREKTLVMFMGFVDSKVGIAPTEHLGFEWLDWRPPHQIQTQTIDPVLHAIEMSWKNHPER